MENGLAKQDMLPSLHGICKTGNEKEKTRGAFLVPNCSSLQSPALGAVWGGFLLKHC